MKVFKFTDGDYRYVCSGRTEQEATEIFYQQVGVGEFDGVEEVTESEWDEKVIHMNEDNDFEKPGFKVSIREILESDPMLICTNDNSVIN